MAIRAPDGANKGEKLIFQIFFADLGFTPSSRILQHRILQTEVFVARMQRHWDCANFLQLQKSCTLSRLQSTHSQTQKSVTMSRH